MLSLPLLMKKIYLSILLILILCFGYIIALQSSHAAMSMSMSGNSEMSCLGHCFETAAPFSQNTTILPTALMLLALLAIVTVMEVYRERGFRFSIPLFSYIPYYQFSTVVLRE